jgi:hypothetical protein
MEPNDKGTPPSEQDPRRTDRKEVRPPVGEADKDGKGKKKAAAKVDGALKGPQGMTRSMKETSEV